MCRMAAKHPDRKIPRPASRPLETLTKIAAQNPDGYFFKLYLLSRTVVPALLRISTRQLQRIRKQYNLKWLKRGREVLYFLGPLIEAINVYHLPWDPDVFDKIRTNYKNRPRL